MYGTEICVRAKVNKKYLSMLQSIVDFCRTCKTELQSILQQIT
jgi:hypothetical protein